MLDCLKVNIILYQTVIQNFKTFDLILNNSLSNRLKIDDIEWEYLLNSFKSSGTLTILCDERLLAVFKVAKFHSEICGSLSLHIGVAQWSEQYGSGLRRLNWDE